MSITAQHLPDPRHVIVDVAFLCARYGRQKSYIYELVKGPQFPGEVAKKRWRLDHVLAYEDAVGRRGAGNVAGCAVSTGGSAVGEPAVPALAAPLDDILRRPQPRLPRAEVTR